MNCLLLCSCSMLYKNKIIWQRSMSTHDFFDNIFSIKNRSSDLSDNNFSIKNSSSDFPANNSHNKNRTTEVSGNNSHNKNRTTEVSGNNSHNKNRTTDDSANYSHSKNCPSDLSDNSSHYMNRPAEDYGNSNGSICRISSQSKIQMELVFHNSEGTGFRFAYINVAFDLIIIEIDYPASPLYSAFATPDIINSADVRMSTLSKSINIAIQAA